MVQTSKWDDIEISDLRLNEQTIFWGTSDPTSGLPINAYFLNTTEQRLKQNTGTEGSPVWTTRLEKGIDDGFDFVNAPLVNSKRMIKGEGTRRLVMAKDVGVDPQEWFPEGELKTNPILLHGFTYANQTAADAAWDSNNFTDYRIDVTDDEIDPCDAARSGTYDQSIAFTLPSNASDSKWTWRFKLHITTRTATTVASVAHWFAMLADNQHSGSTVSQDALGIKITSVSSAFSGVTMDANGEALTAAASDGQAFTVPAVSSTTFWVIRRTSTTTYDVIQYSDATYETVVEADLNIACSAGIINLSHIKFANFSNNAGTNQVLNIEVSDMEFWDDIVI